MFASLFNWPLLLSVIEVVELRNDVLLLKVMPGLNVMVVKESIFQIRVPPTR